MPYSPYMHMRLECKGPTYHMLFSHVPELQHFWNFTAFSKENDLYKTRQNHSSIHIYVFPVLVPPQWATDPPPKNITIVIEKNGTLECKVTAKPPAEVSWYKNGQQQQSSEYVHFVALHDINQICHPCISFYPERTEILLRFHTGDEALQKSVQSLGLVDPFAEKNSYRETTNQTKHRSLLCTFE